jgi:hypothetical protein
VTSACVAGFLLVPASPARADPAGPTDYRSEVVAVVPEVPGVRAEAIGGDAFIVLEVEAGVTVEVIGYRGEPYLRFLPDGTVERNARSPSTYLNEDRYAEVDVPPGVAPEAEPLWEPVAADGSYAWHDHRTHWMNEARPPGRNPGDQILEGVVPLIVDGTEVDVTVISVWEPPPSALPVVLGAAAGMLAAFWSFRSRGLILPAAGLSGIALGLGAAAFASVPAETAPSSLMWVVPAVGLVVVSGAAARGSAPVTSAAALLVAAELLVWAVLRWDWLWRAIIPTNLPFWADRAGTALVMTGAVGLGAAAGWRTLRPDAARPER